MKCTKLLIVEANFLLAHMNKHKNVEVLAIPLRELNTTDVSKA